MWEAVGNGINVKVHVHTRVPINVEESQNIQGAVSHIVT